MRDFVFSITDMDDLAYKNNSKRKLKDAINEIEQYRVTSSTSNKAIEQLVVDQNFLNQCCEFFSNHNCIVIYHGDAFDDVPGEMITDHRIYSAINDTYKNFKQ